MDDLSSVLEKLERGEQYYKGGKLENAEFLLIEAREWFERSSLKEYQARASIGLADVYTASGKHDFAIEAANKATELTAQIDIAAKAHLRRGICFRRLGEFPQSLHDLDQAVRLYGEIGDVIKLAETNIAIGDVHWKQQKWEAAIGHYRETLSIITPEVLSGPASEESQFHQAQAKYAIGRLAILNCEYDEAKQNLNESYRLLLKIENFFGLSMCEQLKGNLFEKRGNLSQARFWYSESLVSNLSEGNPLRKAETTYYIANLKHKYRRKDGFRAKSLILVTYEDALNFQFNEICFWLKQLLANIYLDDDDLEKAYQEYNKALWHALKSDPFVVLDFIQNYEKKFLGIQSAEKSDFVKQLTEKLLSYFENLRLDEYSGAEYEQKKMLKAGVVNKDGVISPRLMRIINDLEQKSR